jgi:hypothetical protein
VSSVVAGVESSASELVEGEVLIRNGDRNSPEMDIRKTENMTDQLVVRTPPENQKCEVSTDAS